MMTMTLALVLMSGCALLRQIGDMSPKQKAVWMMSTFVAQLNALKTEARWYWSDQVSDADRLVMRWKMTLLQKAYPLIKGYADAAERGEDPGLVSEDTILDLINQVIDAAAGKVPAGVKLADPPPKPRVITLPKQSI
jgi:hypothetical protein